MIKPQVKRPEESSPLFRWPNWTTVLQAMIILFAGLWIYWPVRNGDWLWDDDSNITLNGLAHDPNGWWNAWFQRDGMRDYYPLESIAQWIEWHLFGNQTTGYHLANMGLHLGSAFLLWILLRKLDIRAAWWGALLFTVHPIMVESVAWVSELKNVLSLPPLLLAMIAFLSFEATRKRTAYLTSLSGFVVAMLVKTSGVMLPMIFLFYAWWKRGQITGRDLKAATPFFLVSLVLGTVSLWARHPATSGVIEPGGWDAKLASAGMALVYVFGKSIFPLHLLPLYPSEAIASPPWSHFLPLPLVAGILYFFWRHRATWGRHLLFGVGFFLLNLLPVLAFILINYGTMIWSLDHLVYLPVIGLIALAAAGLSSLSNASAERHLASTIGASAIIVLLAIASRSYAKTYRNPAALWTYTLQLNPDAYLAHNNLANSFLQQGRTDEAIAHYKEALRLKPNFADAHNDLGYVLENQGKIAEAHDQYTQAVQLKPESADIHTNLGNVLCSEGHLVEAVDQYRLALQIRPFYAEPHNNLGNVFLQTNQFAQARAEYLEALRINPEFSNAHFGMGIVFIQIGQVAEAIGQFQECLQIDPKNLMARTDLGTCYFKLGRRAEAENEFRAVLQIDPHQIDARNDLIKLQAAQEEVRAPANGGLRNPH